MTLPGAEPFSEELTQKLTSALSKKGPDYEPRTHHKGADGRPKFINRLIFETSPYLLQHAHNPVSWFPWGPAAFALARKLGRPVLLSVGYSTCHWCHVMERESFEDEEIAAYINENFVAIKVDREERPDVDDVYMSAVQLMTGGGGWPMTVVMTPDAKPFFGGTYFPARDGDRGARVGFLTILNRLAAAYASDRENVLNASEKLTQTMMIASRRGDGTDVPGPELLIEAAKALRERYDDEWGGFGRAPKFPRPSTYELLLRYHRRTGDAAALEMVTHSLKRMFFGGMYDQLGGGFHRYSTDARWLVPHFEKMLYDNAQLVVLALETWQITQDETFEELARETLDYVLREMTSPEGAFYSATDADSEGEEGKFFVWGPDEIEEIIGPDAELFNGYYDVTSAGNFEGHNILNRKSRDPATEQKLAAAKKKLYDHRKKRIPPLLDDKILTEWNAQMITAFARAGLTLKDERYAGAAKKAGAFILKTMKKDGRLKRAYRQGTAKHEGVLEDYGFLVAALIDLYELTGDEKWLSEAVELHAKMNELFEDEKAGAYFGTASDGEKLLIREKPIYDGAQPSGNAYAAMNALRLYELTTDESYRKSAVRTFQALGESLGPNALPCPKLALALDFMHDEPKEIVLVTNDQDDGAALSDVIRKTFLPNKVLVQVDESKLGELQKTVPLVEGKVAMKKKATAYVCVKQACKKPTSDPAELKLQVAEVVNLVAKPL